jgi:hypothetical protein
LTGIVSALLASGFNIRSAAKKSSKVNRIAGCLARATARCHTGLRHHCHSQGRSKRCWVTVCRIIPNMTRESNRLDNGIGS